MAARICATPARTTAAVVARDMPRKRKLAQMPATAFRQMSELLLGRFRISPGRRQCVCVRLGEGSGGVVPRNGRGSAGMRCVFLNQRFGRVCFGAGTGGGVGLKLSLALSANPSPASQLDAFKGCLTNMMRKKEQLLKKALSQRQEYSRSTRMFATSNMKRTQMRWASAQQLKCSSRKKKL